MRARPGTLLEVWVPRVRLVGTVDAAVVGPVAISSADDIAADRTEPAGPPVLSAIGLPGRVSGGGNLRSWPAVKWDTLLRALPHNAPVRVIASVAGDDGDLWYSVDSIDAATQSRTGTGFLHSSTLRLPRLGANRAPDRAATGRWLEADLLEPAMLTAFEDGSPVWATLTIKGTASNRTPLGDYRIVTQVLRETMDGKRCDRQSPVAFRAATTSKTSCGRSTTPGVEKASTTTTGRAGAPFVLSSWGYACSHGCLGLPYDEAKWVWDFAEIGCWRHRSLSMAWEHCAMTVRQDDVHHHAVGQYERSQWSA
jgi:hypothetical protein